MTRDDVAALLERHRASFQRLDAAAIAADHARDGIFDSPAHGVIRGRAAIEEVYRYWFSAFPDLEFTWDRPLVDGTRVAIFWSFRGTVSGPFFGMADAGTRIEMNGAAEYYIGSEGIERARHVFDFSSVLVKAGILKLRPR